MPKVQAGLDVLGLGAVSVDELVLVNEFPKPDSKVPMLRQERQAGGQAGTALVAAARLGARCAYAGALDRDDLSRFVIDGLGEEGVSTEWIVKRIGARPLHNAVLFDVKAKTRAILVDMSANAGGADAELPPEELILSTRVLLVDHAGLAGMTRAARIARRAGIPILGDFESHGPEPFEELLSLTDHLVVPRSFARELTGTQRGAAAVRALWDSSRSAVVVTAGADGAWYSCREMGDRICHQPAFFVDVEDTTGCGDVFHGAYAAALALGLGMKEWVWFAAAAAAIKASRSGGQKGAPSRAEVEEFLSRREGDAVCREADRGAF
jgi:sulfofructose kinase